MSTLTDPPKPKFRLSQLIYDTRYRSITIQFVALILIVLGLGWLATNTVTNLKALGKDFDFGFLNSAAGYDINQMLIPYDNQQANHRPQNSANQSAQQSHQKTDANGHGQTAEHITT